MVVSGQSLAKLAPHIEDFGKGSKQAVGLYGLAIRASVVKAFEFAKYSWREPSPTDPFFAMATLRGICEDYIALSFLQPLSPANRETAIDCRMKLSMRHAFEAQVAFFDSERPWQPTMSADNSSVQGASDDLGLITRMLLLPIHLQFLS